MSVRCAVSVIDAGGYGIRYDDPSSLAPHRAHGGGVRRVLLAEAAVGPRHPLMKGASTRSSDTVRPLLFFDPRATAHLLASMLQPHTHGGDLGHIRAGITSTPPAESR